MTRVAFIGGLAILLTSSLSCSDRAAKLPVYDKVPDFSAADSDGATFNRRQMNGKVWVVDFIYTNCPAACPLMSSHMRRLAADLASDRDVRFLSISVDPARDTPEAMQRFARRYGGANERWKFITGSPATVHRIAYETFHVADVLGKIEHSTKFMTVDKHGQIRGYYASNDPQELARLKLDVASLSAAR